MPKKRPFQFFLLFIAAGIFLVAVGFVGLLPMASETKVLVVSQAPVGAGDFNLAVEATEKVTRTLAEYANFEEFREGILASGFQSTNELFVGSKEESYNLWRRVIKIEPVEDAFVIKIKAKGASFFESQQLVAVIGQYLVLEIPRIIGGGLVRGIVDRPTVVYVWPRELSISIAVAGAFSLVAGSIGLVFLMLNRYFSQSMKPVAVSMKTSNFAGKTGGPKVKDEEAKELLQKFLNDNQGK